MKLYPEAADFLDAKRAEMPDRHIDPVWWNALAEVATLLRHGQRRPPGASVDWPAGITTLKRSP